MLVPVVFITMQCWQKSLLLDRHFTSKNKLTTSVSPK